MAGSNQLNLDESTVRSVVEEVLRNLTQSGGVPAGAPPSSPNGCSRSRRRFGVFDEAAEASRAALDAFHQLREKGVAGRRKVVEIVKGLCEEKAEEWGRLEFEETKIGRLDHKVEKLQIVKLVPGVEWLDERQLARVQSWREKYSKHFQVIREDKSINLWCHGEDHLHNGYYPTPDAEIYLAMILDHRPERKAL